MSVDLGYLHGIPDTHERSSGASRSRRFAKRWRNGANWEVVVVDLTHEHCPGASRQGRFAKGLD